MPRYIVIAADHLIAAEGAQAHLPPGVPVEQHFVEDLDIERIFSQLATADLFGSERAFVYRDFLNFKPSKRETERLAQIFERMPAEVTLVASQVLREERKADEERKLGSAAFKAWTDGAKIDDLRSLSQGVQAVRWLKRRALERYGVEITEAQTKRILSANGDELSLAETELGKLALAQEDPAQRAVSDQTLEWLLSHSPKARFNELIDAIMQRAPTTHNLLNEWFGLEPNAGSLLWALNARLLGLRALARRERLAQPWLESQLRRFSGKWPEPRLNRAILALAQAEHDLKSGAIPGESSKDTELAILQLLAADLTRA